MSRGYLEVSTLSDIHNDIMSRKNSAHIEVIENNKGSIESILFRRIHFQDVNFESLKHSHLIFEECEGDSLTVIWRGNAFEMQF